MDVEGRRDFWGAIRRHDAEQGRHGRSSRRTTSRRPTPYADRIILLRPGGRISAPIGRPRRSGTLSTGRVGWGEAWRAPIRRRSPKLPGVRSASRSGRVAVIIQTTDSDAVARYLLTATPARDVEIVAHNLEDAFLGADRRRGDERPGTPGRRQAPGMTTKPVVTLQTLEQAKGAAAWAGST